MKIVFISNYFNHHQKPFSDEMYEKIGDGYIFIETEEMEKERKDMGWSMKNYPSYVVSWDKLSKNIPQYIKLINDADAVIIGSAPERFIEERKKQKKLIFRYYERPLKKGLEPLKYIPRFIKWHKQNPKNVPIYLLCASAYAAGDYSKFRLFKDRCYKWGYFPECIRYDDINTIISEKRPKSILWVGRLIDWKHPELVIEIAKRLEEEGYRFDLNIIGNGIMEDELRKMIKKEKLNNCVHLLGSMKPEKVRKYMEKSEIFLFTSNQKEGWGAVVNEAMNSGCAVVVSSAAGCVPFLVENGKNGYIYKNGEFEDFYKKVRLIMDDDERRREFGNNAYCTIAEVWNAQCAANLFLKFVNCMIENKKCHIDEGPCSPAETLKKSRF